MNLFQTNKKIYGVGNKLSALFIKHIGYKNSCKLNKGYNNYMVSDLYKLLQYKEQFIEKDLKKTISDNLKKKMRAFSYQGFLLRHSLPIRGQRRRSNAKTIKSFIGKNRY